MGKEDLREQVWRDLKPLAKPDSRFDLDFSNFIPVLFVSLSTPLPRTFQL